VYSAAVTASDCRWLVLDEKKKDLAAKKRKTLGAAITYFENNQDHMHYDEYLAAGYPITPQRHLGGSTPFKPD
jgi:hypothetical protein